MSNFDFGKTYKTKSAAITALPAAYAAIRLQLNSARVNDDTITENECFESLRNGLTVGKLSSGEYKIVEFIDEGDK